MNTSTHINQEEITYLNLAIHDEIGRVFSWGGELYREIYPSGEEMMDDFIHSGCYEELAEKKYVPQTTLTTYKTERSKFVLHHERIDFVRYPFEWSFSMLKDAALFVVDVNEIAFKYGFETKDCHPYNIIFNTCQPTFIDFGSFRKRYPHQRGWRGKFDFKQSYEYPLKTWKRSGDFSARALLSYAVEGGIPLYNYYRNKSLFYRLLPPNLLKKGLVLFHEFNLISSFPKEHVSQKFPFGLGDFALKLNDLGLLPFQRTNFNSLRRRINRIKVKSASTMWSNYHNMYVEDGELKVSSRFSRILQIVDELGLKSVLEFAGNQGLVSKLLLKNTGVERVVCTDYDTQAIDILYDEVKQTDLKLCPMVYDLKFPITADHLPSFGERFKGHDASFALALTHHLLLTQKMSMDWILSSIDVIKSKYLFIEFMPLGLWSPKYPDKEIKTPSWYTIDWYRSELEKKYKILYEEQLEKNRILFVGERLD